MLATKQKATLNFLYDTHASKVLGFIISQNYSRSEGEHLLIKVFLEVWRDTKAFDDVAQTNHFLMIIRITAKFIHEENRLNLATCLLKKGAQSSIAVTHRRFYSARLKSRS